MIRAREDKQWKDPLGAGDQLLAGGATPLERGLWMTLRACDNSGGDSAWAQGLEIGQSSRLPPGTCRLSEIQLRDK